VCISVAGEENFYILSDLTYEGCGGLGKVSKRTEDLLIHARREL